jgi:hypothetical protein
MDAVEVSLGIAITTKMLTLVLRVKLDTAGGRSKGKERSSNSWEILHIG